MNSIDEIDVAEAERAQKAVWAEVHGQDPSRTYTVAEVKRLVYTLDNAISALVSRPASPARETVTEERVRSAALAMYRMSNELSMSGARDLARAALEAALTEKGDES